MLRMGLNVNPNFKYIPMAVPCDIARLWSDDPTGVTETAIYNSNGTVNTARLASLFGPLFAAMPSIAEIVYQLGGTPYWCSQDATDTDCDGEGIAAGACDPYNDLNPDGSGTNQNFRNFCAAVGLMANTLPLIQFHFAPGINEFTRNDTVVKSAPYSCRGFLGGNTNFPLNINLQLLRMVQDARAILVGRGTTIQATGETISQVWSKIPAAFGGPLTAPAYSKFAGAKILSPSSGIYNSYDAFYQSYIQQSFGVPGGGVIYPAIDAAEVLDLHGYGPNGSFVLGKLPTFQNFFKIGGKQPPSEIWLTESGSNGVGAVTPDVFLNEIVPGLSAAGVTRFIWWSLTEGQPLIDLTNSGALTAAGQAWINNYNSYDGK